MERRHHHLDTQAPRKFAGESKSPSEPPRNCPRCESTNTKFCYYNNYSSSQPRYFCRACRRYWTQGGALRNLPHGSSAAARAAAKHSKPPYPAASASPTASVVPLHHQMGVGSPAWCFVGDGLLRQPMGFGVVDPSMVVGIRNAAAAQTAMAGGMNSAGRDEGGRNLVDLFGGFEDGGSSSGEGRMPEASSGPFI